MTKIILENVKKSYRQPATHLKFSLQESKVIEQNKGYFWESDCGLITSFIVPMLIERGMIMKAIVLTL